MIKSDRHIKAIELRNKYKTKVLTIMNSQNGITPKKRTFPVYLDNWLQRILLIEYLIIDLKYGVAIKKSL